MSARHAKSDRPTDGAQAGLSPQDAGRLWEKFRAGGNPAGRAALDALYRALRRPLVEFCRWKGCDAELADEIAEAAFIRLIDRRPVARRGFIALLRKTAQNLCHDAMKRRGHPPSLRSSPASAPDPSEEVSRDETVEAVRECLATLDDADRLLLVYHHVDGLTQRAACQLLGLDAAPSTINARLTRIREQLARCLKKKMIF